MIQEIGIWYLTPLFGSREDSMFVIPPFARKTTVTSQSLSSPTRKVWLTCSSFKNPGLALSPLVVGYSDPPILKYAGCFLLFSPLLRAFASIISG